MTQQETERFDMLRDGPCVTLDYLQGFYGLSWPFEGDLQADYSIWASQLRRPANCEEGWVSRFEIESFLQQKGVIPKKWQAVRMGMTLASLESVLGLLPKLGMRPQRYLFYPELIATAFLDDLVQTLNPTKYLTQIEHNEFCEALHSDIDQRLKIKIDPMFCATSEGMEESPLQYAHEFDCITLEPVSIKHLIWIDFNKPRILGPDRCSKLLGAEEWSTLSPHFVAQIDQAELETYFDFLAGKQHA